MIGAPGPAVAWIALRVELPSTIAESVANFLLEAGAPAVVTEERDFTVGPETSPERARLEASLPAAEIDRVVAGLDRYLGALRALDPGLGAARLETAPVPAVDWTAVARRHHRAVAVGHRLLIAPPWDVPPASEREVLVVEPGMAFGTGQHATTRGCLLAIEAAVVAGGIGSALDVGTGSGILATALARLGVPRVVALDQDPAVLAIARTTFLRNGAARVLLLGGSVAAVRGGFDLVVANLLAGALVSEAQALAAVVAPGGRLVMSGVLAAQVDEVTAAYPAWSLGATHAEDGWRTLTLVRAT